MIKLKTLKWKNFLSYGNNDNVFNFEKGISYISGENGSGKSCLKDVLSFCLFGVGYRNINKDNLFNEINKEKLYTELTFTQNNIDYRIIRSLKPDSLEIWKNDKLLDSDSSNRLIQQNINDILKFDWNFFKRTVALSSNNKSFFKMSDKERNDYFEKFFDIEILNRMEKKNKTELIDFMAKDSLISREIEMLEKNLVDHKSTLEKIEKIAANDESKIKKEELEKLKEELKEKITQYKTDSEEFAKENNMTVLKENKENINKDLQRHRNLLHTHQKEIENLEKAISNIEKSGSAECPFCSQSINEEKLLLLKKKNEEHLEHKQHRLRDIQVFTEEIEGIDKSIRDIKEKDELIKEAKKNISLMKNRYDYLKSSVENENRSNNEEIKKNIYEILENIVKNKDDKTTEREKNMENLAVAETIRNILSKGSFSKFFYTRFTPLLEQKYNSNLSNIDFKGSSIKCRIGADLSIMFYNIFR